MQAVDEVLHQVLRGAGPGGDEDGEAVREPVRVQFFFIVDEIGGFAFVSGGLDEALAVGGVLAADDQHEVGVFGQFADGTLAVGGGVADVVFGGGFDVGVARFEGGDDPLGIGNAEGGLGDVGELGVGGEGEVGDFGVGLDDGDDIGGLAHRADGFVVVAVADEDDVVALFGEPQHLHVDLGDKGAGGIDFVQLAFLTLAADLRGDAVGAVDDDAACWYLVDGIDEDDAAAAEVVDDVPVVDDFVENVDGRALKFQDLIHDINGHVDAGTESTGVGQNDLHTLSVHHRRVWAGRAKRPRRVLRCRTMPEVRPFAAIRFNRRLYADVSPVIAPPYDVLDAAAKAELLGRNEHNVVAVDLPVCPAKDVGPDMAYVAAAELLGDWLQHGVMEQDKRRAMYPYTQVFTDHGRVHHRRGVFVLVKLTALGEGIGGVIPHEKTHKGPIEDRLKLMHATGVQASPVFGLFHDPQGKVMNLLYSGVGRPEQHGHLGSGNHSVEHQMWSVIDAHIEQQVIDLLRDKPVYIADGHHRYTTALQYQADVAKQLGVEIKDIPISHPANYCLFCLVPLEDSGLKIWPTHRLLGGMSPFSADTLAATLSGLFTVQELSINITEVVPSELPEGVFVIYDGVRKEALLLTPGDNLHTAMAKIQPGRPEAYRKLDVAVLEHLLISGVIEPTFGQAGLTRGYSATVADLVHQLHGSEYQLGIIIRPTPLKALAELGSLGETMPQKSTYFYPKLATGMVMAPLSPAQAHH